MEMSNLTTDLSSMKVVSTYKCDGSFENTNNKNKMEMPIKTFSNFEYQSILGGFLYCML